MTIGLTTQIEKKDLKSYLASRWRVPAPSRQDHALRRGIALLASLKDHKLSTKASQLRVPEQPFDAHLLSLSPLYRRSRERFFATGGSIRPALVSGPRSLGSPTLLEPIVEYSPVESEYLWSTPDPRRLLTIRSYVTSLFHEQNHRILWHHLPSAPHSVSAIRRYLNFAESWVIGIDMALGDELGPKLANLFYLTGATYDPGTRVRSEIGSKRAYRNYLQAACYASYLNLELYKANDIIAAIRSLYGSLGEFAERAARRSINLDRAFVHKTNPIWQKRHSARVIESLSEKGNPGLCLPGDPLDNREFYLFGEHWLATFGL